MVIRKGTITWLSYLIVDIHLHTSRALEIMRHLEERGYDNTLIATRSAKNLPRRKNQHLILIPIRYKTIISSIFFAIVVLLYLPFHIVVSKPKYIIVSADFSIIGSIPCALLAKLTKTKFILDIRSTPVDTPGLPGAFRKLVFHISVLIAKNLFSGLTIITPLMRKSLCSSYKINQSKVGVWTSGVSSTSFNPEKYSISGSELKHSLNLDDKFIVFYHGVLSDNRGTTATVEAIKLLRQKYPEIVLFLLGSPRYSKLNELLLDEGLHENVIIHDPITHEKVPKFVSISDICIIPLLNIPIWRYQSPLKLLEYLAMEKVVIVSAIPAHNDVIGTEECGIYLQSVNPSEIAKAIMYAYLNSNRLASWGKSGRVIVQKNYTWEKVAKDVENYLHSVDLRYS